MFEGKIPFYPHGGGLVSYYGRSTKGPYSHLDPAYIWEDNAPFRATFNFKRFERGRSAAHAIYAKADAPDWEAVMFLSDLEDVLQRGLSLKKLQGRFVYVKRGSNYGIQMLLIDA